MTLNLNNKNNKEANVSPSLQKISLLEFILILFVLIIFGYLIFSFISQIYLMNLELKHLVSLVQSLQDNQIDLKNQLLIKDQQINLLESTLKDLNSSTSSITTLNDTQNFELLKKEVMKNNNDMSQLYLTTTGLVLSIVLILKLLKFF